MDTKRHWFAIVLIIVFTLATLSVIGGEHLRYSHAHWKFYLYWPAPWLLTFLAIRAWHQCFIWRRMLSARLALVEKLRGIKTLSNSQAPTRTLEHICFITACLGFCGVLVQLKVQNASEIILWAIALWFGIRLIISNGKPS